MPFDSLNVAPLIAALKNQPEDFALAGSPSEGTLTHPKSGHNFHVSPGERLGVNAYCGCAYLKVSRSSTDEVRNAIGEWNKEYWEPHVAEVGEAHARHEVNMALMAGHRDYQQAFHHGDGNAHFASHFTPTAAQRERMVRKVAEAEEAARQAKIEAKAQKRPALARFIEHVRTVRAANANRPVLCDAGDD